MIEFLITLISSVQGHWWSVPAFILMYVIACVGFPTTPFPMMAGVLFGFWPGLIYSLFSLAVGSSITFFISRRWGRRLIDRFWKGRSIPLLPRNPGFLVVVIARMTGLPPILMANLLAGMSEMPFIVFLSGTIVGYVPWCVVTNLFANTLWEAFLTGGMGGFKREFLAQAQHLFLAGVTFLVLVLLAAWLGRKLMPPPLPPDQESKVME
jgi:uncharacterized membrane protein YdjX (TVP38/TMEM64 family)